MLWLSIILKSGLHADKKDLKLSPYSLVKLLIDKFNCVNLLFLTRKLTYKIILLPSKENIGSSSGTGSFLDSTLIFEFF